MATEIVAGDIRYEIREDGCDGPKAVEVQSEVDSQVVI